MNPQGKGKRAQLRSSWWSLASEGQSWLSSARQRANKKTFTATTPVVRLGVQAVKK